jgi:hypothetical protein
VDALTLENHFVVFEGGGPPRSTEMSDTRAEILQRIIRREPKSQSSFGTGEGVSLVATALSRIADEKITITEFYSTLTCVYY